MMTTPKASADAGKSQERSVNAHYDTRLPDLTWSRRIQNSVHCGAVYSVIRTLGRRCVMKCWDGSTRSACTLRNTASSGVLAPSHYSIVWRHRNKGVVVMNTTAFDGQWTRKVIEWLGFGTAQGSSSRGGLRGLAVMARRLEEG